MTLQAADSALWDRRFRLSFCGPLEQPKRLRSVVGRAILRPAGFQPAQFLRLAKSPLGPVRAGSGAGRHRSGANSATPPETRQSMTQTHAKLALGGTPLSSLPLIFNRLTLKKGLI